MTQDIFDVAAHLTAQAEAQTDEYSARVFGETAIPSPVQSLAREAHNLGYLRCVQDLIAYLTAAHAADRGQA